MNTQIKVTTNSVIENLKFLGEVSGNIQTVLKTAAPTLELTDQFLEEFHDVLTPEIVLSSYHVNASKIMKSYPEFWSEDEFLKNVIPTKLSFESYIAFKEAIEKVHPMNEEEINKMVRASTITDPYLFLDVFGKYESTDKIILSRVVDPEIREAFILAQAAENVSALTSESMKYLSNETKEKMLGRENIKVELFLNAINSTDDIGWVNRMIAEAKSFEKTYDDLYNNAVVAISKLSNNDSVKLLLKLYQAAPYTFNFKFMEILLNRKEFSEEELISLIPCFKQSESLLMLKRFANSNNYEKLLSAIKN